MSGDAPARLQASQRVVLRWSASEGGEGACSGRLRPVTAQRMLFFPQEAAPALAALPLGQAMRLEIGTPGGLASIPARLRHYDGDGGAVAMIVTGSASVREQRRFPRVAVNLPPVAVTRVDPPDEAPHQFTVRLCDLSAGGLQFLSQEALHPLERVQVFLTLQDTAPIAPILTVLASEREALADPGGAEAAARYRVRGAFTTLAGTDQQQLVDFVTRQQVAELRTFL